MKTKSIELLFPNGVQAGMVWNAQVKAEYIALLQTIDNLSTEAIAAVVNQTEQSYAILQKLSGMGAKFSVDGSLQNLGPFADVGDKVDLTFREGAFIRKQVI